MLYRRDEVDFMRVTRYYHQGSLNKTGSGGNEYYGHYPEFNYIGFPFGGDTMALTAGAFEKASKTYLNKTSDIQASFGVSCKL